MTNAPLTSIEQYLDIESLNHHALATAAGAPEAEVMASLAAKSRDHARTPMQWDDTEHAGFTAGEPWSAVNPNYRAINAAATRRDPNSIFVHFQALIRLRHELEIVREGRFELLAAEHEQLWAFTRTHDNAVLLVLANCSSEPLSLAGLELPGSDDAQLLLGTHTDSDPHALAPWESRVLQLA